MIQFLIDILNNCYQRIIYYDYIVLSNDDELFVVDNDYSLKVTLVTNTNVLFLKEMKLI